MKIKYVFVKLILVFVLFSIHSGFAQLSAYHSIVFPYEQRFLAGKSLGGASVAVPDYVPDARGNPAGLVFTETIQFFAAINAERIEYRPDYEYKYLQISENVYSQNQFYPSQFSFAVPFRLFNKKTTIAVSLNKLNSPEIETLDIQKITKNSGFIHNRSGNVWTSSLGISTLLAENFSLGLSWTRWNGNWKWQDEQYRNVEYNLNAISGAGNYKYNGSSFNLGLMKQFHKLSIGLVVNSPFTLMKAENVQIKLWGPIEENNLEQRFNGAVSAGIAYQLFRKFRLGLGYRYQDDFMIKNVPDIYTEKNETKYSNSHKVSIAGEYTFNISSLQIPFFLVYNGQWLPLTLDSNPGYEFLTISKDNRFQNNAVMGVNMYYKSIGFHFMTLWQQYSIYVNQDLVYLPAPS